MNFYTRRRRIPQVNIISLIDIFAILLIFVIVTTTFKRPQPAVIIKLPESSTSTAGADAAQTPILLSVAPSGEVFLDGAAVEMEDLAAALQKVVAKGQSLALNADTKAPFGIIVRVMDALKEAGLKGNMPAFTETIQSSK
jgi:biopolymer transport protein ExbD